MYHSDIPSNNLHDLEPNPVVNTKVQSQEEPNEDTEFDHKFYKTRGKAEPAVIFHCGANDAWGLPWRLRNPIRWLGDRILINFLEHDVLLEGCDLWELFVCLNRERVTYLKSMSRAEIDEGDMKSYVNRITVKEMDAKKIAGE